MCINEKFVHTDNRTQRSNATYLSFADNVGDGREARISRRPRGAHVFYQAPTWPRIYDISWRLPEPCAGEI